MLYVITCPNEPNTLCERILPAHKANKIDAITAISNPICRFKTIPKMLVLMILTTIPIIKDTPNCQRGRSIETKLINQNNPSANMNISLLIILILSSKF